MDLGRLEVRDATRRKTVMAKLLDHSFADATLEYDPDATQRVYRDIEMALTRMEFPQRIEGKDENQAITWFFG